ncbi:MAG: BREX-1 system adenine-specific DNA-methyltransferase PglX [Polyangiaceae bacterium]|nr:BREX-1 system adenine-specific DNA-methyltransferase PglX [Polyangiaceae bacterium]
MKGDVSSDRRAALARAVAVCRRVLVGDRREGGAAGDLGEQLEAPLGFDPRTGVPLAMAGMGHLRSWQVGPADMLRAWHAHLVTTAPGASDAERARAGYDQMKYEIGYTVLHRLCALRMAEEREIVRPCVSKGRDSDGFKLYLKVAPDSALGTYEEAYAFFLARLYDELARDLPAVFDRRIAPSLVFPRPAALEAVLAALNAPELTQLWTEDETLGWIFEDYNDADERKEMREHDAPRNARELAVRNQFFTPRWVVEFLTDNTLGRLWCEQTGGETTLAQSCQFLARAPGQATREARDPRDILVLDPACGSGHFLLYAFDLFETIYREAWRSRRHKGADRTPLWEEFPDERAFESEIPRLILRHNLHGVDIDPRCLQEAALALWLRAHRSWQRLGLKARERPAIAKVNLVCAEALPNAPALRKDLLAKLKPAVLGRLAEALLARAGEMGILLRAETAMAETVAAVKKEYRAWKERELELFPELAPPRQTTIGEFVELRELGDDAFWLEAETRLGTALDELTDGAEDAEHYRSRLFAEDVRHGLEFFELGRQKFDVILMNPPFGEPSESTKEALDAAYVPAGHELYAMFYERTLEMLRPGGRVGAITNRSWLALPTLEKFRCEVLGKKGTVELAADLGYGVLNAKVETAAAVLRLGGDVDAPATWIRLVKTGRKRETLLEALRNPVGHRAVSVVSARRFEGLPTQVYGYWMSPELAQLYGAAKTVETVADAVVGTQTSDDGRFLRLAWEVLPQVVGLSATWARFAKGGEHRFYFDDVHLVIRWVDGGKEIAAFPKAFIRNAQYYGKPGVTWPPRTNLRLSPRALPAGCAFGHMGPSAIAPGDPPHVLLAVLSSTPAYLLLSVRFQTADDSPRSISKAYEVGRIRDLPWPKLSAERVGRLASLAQDAVALARLAQLEDDDSGETAVAFAVPPILLAPRSALEAATRHRTAERERVFTELARIQGTIDDIVTDAYGFSERDREVMDEELEPALVRLPSDAPIDDELFRTAYLTKGALDGARLPGGLDAEAEVRVEHRRGKQMRLRDLTTLCRLFQVAPSTLIDKRSALGLLRPDDVRRAAADLVSYAVGAAFGRWDVRLAAHPEWIPSFADAFDPLPACPLGQLVQADGLPATEDRIGSETWLASRRHPTALPPRSPSAEIGAGGYPLRVAWDGLLADDTLDDASPRHASESFLARVGAVLEHLFGRERGAWEADIAHALGVSSVAAWLRAPTGFFADHVARYSKSQRVAPIYWPLSTQSGGLTVWLYAPRLDAHTLPLVVNRLRAGIDDRRDERAMLQKEAQTNRTKEPRLALVTREVTERQALHDALSALLARGYAPHADDGYVVTAAPLHFAFRLGKWRELLAATYAGLERGDYDWAQLAMRLRPAEVRAKCRTDRSLAIAHGLEADCQAAGKAKRAKKAPARRAPRDAAKQKAPAVAPHPVLPNVSPKERS